MINVLLYLLLGLVAGIFSGLIGIGGGTIIVPALVFLFGLSQHQAPRHHIGFASATHRFARSVDIL